MKGKDPFVGRVFEDADPRSVGRRVRVIAKRSSLVGGERWRAVRINVHGHEVRSKPLSLTREQLENDYRKATTMASRDEVKGLIDELRKAAGSIREVIRKVRMRPARTGSAEAIATCKAMGFARTEQALAVAAVLEEASDEAWLSQEPPSELIVVVARIVNRAAL